MAAMELGSRPATTYEVNVRGSNAVARNLDDSLGYQVTASK